MARQKILPVTKSAHLPIPDPKEMEESDDSHDSTEGVKKFWGKVSKSSKFSVMILLRSSHPIEVVTCIIAYFNPIQVNHIAIVVSDIGRSLHFYTDIIGMEQVNRPDFDRHVWRGHPLKLRPDLA